MTLLPFFWALTCPCMLTGNVPWNTPMCNLWLRCSSTYDTHLYKYMLQEFLRCPCMPATDQKMVNSLLLKIISPFPYGQPGYLLGIQSFMLLASCLDFTWGLRAWFVRNKLTSRPSNIWRTCLHNPSPYIPPPLIHLSLMAATNIFLRALVMFFTKW